jgi:DNA-binding transcriptional ArsR family regulator
VDLEERSKLLFGNRHRLRIGDCVAQRNLVTAREVAAELRLADSVVRAELLRLAEAGLLIALPSVQKERFFEQVPDPFWAYCREEVARFGNRGVENNDPADPIRGTG